MGQCCSVLFGRSTLFERIDSRTTLEFEGDDEDACVDGFNDRLLRDSVCEGASDFSDTYRITYKLGGGATCVVHQCMDKQTWKPYAVKVINKRKLLSGMGPKRREKTLNMIQEEIRMLKMLGIHPNIVEFFNVFENDKEIHVVMELLTGGELYDYVMEKGHLTEKAASAIMLQVADALCFVHSRKIAHRDLKPENVVLAQPTVGNDPPLVKLIDFGVSRTVGGVKRSTFVGTLNFMAPEVKDTSIKYDESVDVWGFGVMLYELLCGYLPFDEEGYAANPAMAGKKQYTLYFPPEDWSQISVSVQELLRLLLVIDPAHRITMFEARAHPWPGHHGGSGSGKG